MSAVTQNNESCSESEIYCEFLQDTESVYDMVITK